MSFGGYNQLGLSTLNTSLYPESYKFQSARAALYEYCRKEKVRRIYMPNYICESILPALKSLNIEIIYYPITDILTPEKLPNIELEERSRIFLVNFFGLLDEGIKKIVSKFEPKYFIIDNSQALFSNYIEGTTTIYSPRKFLGIPDGGFLITPSIIDSELEEFDSSQNVGHLLLRSAGCVSQGYAKFLIAEKALDCYFPKKMSRISEYLIECSDLVKIKQKRIENYSLLDRVFRGINRFSLSVDSGAPLCYPLTLDFDVKNLCVDLIDSSIFLPRYWPSESNGVVGQNMYNRTLFLPVDQRISLSGVKELVSIIDRKLFDEYKK